MKCNKFLMKQIKAAEHELIEGSVKWLDIVMCSSIIALTGDGKKTDSQSFRRFKRMPGTKWPRTMIKAWFSFLMKNAE